jgi:putative nucleotidyltransferase with HDIG domain
LYYKIENNILRKRSKKVNTMNKATEKLIDADYSKIREGVMQSLPIVMDIKNDDLRQKVIDAWVFSLSQNSFEKTDEIEGSGTPGGYVKGNQAQHILCVTRMALSLVDCIEKSYNESMHIDRDMLLAAGLCHDVGKPYEYNKEKNKQWSSDPSKLGMPALRHTLYGVYVALTVGLPEEIAHVCGCHSPEGELIKRSLLATIIHHADKASWRIPGCFDNYNF